MFDPCYRYTYTGIRILKFATLSLNESNFRVNVPVVRKKSNNILRRAHSKACTYFEAHSISLISFVVRFCNAQIHAHLFTASVDVGLLVLACHTNH